MSARSVLNHLSLFLCTGPTVNNQRCWRFQQRKWKGLRAIISCDQLIFPLSLVHPEARISKIFVKDLQIWKHRLQISAKIIPRNEKLFLLKSVGIKGPFSYFVTLRWRCSKLDCMSCRFYIIFVFFNLCRYVGAFIEERLPLYVNDPKSGRINKNIL